MPWVQRGLAAATVAVACALSAACTGGSGGGLLVFAAASLTDAFEELASAFEAAHPGSRVELNLANSSSLREQILSGAPGDVFASASTSDMDLLAGAGAVAGAPRIFARNLLEIAVPAGNPAGVTGLQDFADPGLLIGLCAAEIPCGRYARRALASAGVQPSLDSNEPDVRALLTKLAAGELDAGIVYATDVASAGGTVDGIPIPAAHSVQAAYPIAQLSGAPHPQLASEFMAFVLSDPGRRVLAGHGFLAP